MILTNHQIIGLDGAWYNLPHKSSTLLRGYILSTLGLSNLYYGLLSVYIQMFMHQKPVSFNSTLNFGELINTST